MLVIDEKFIKTLSHSYELRRCANAQRFLLFPNTTKNPAPNGAGFLFKLSRINFANSKIRRRSTIR